MIFESSLQSKFCSNELVHANEGYVGQIRGPSRKRQVGSLFHLGASNGCYFIYSGELNKVLVWYSGHEHLSDYKREQA